MSYFIFFCLFNGYYLFHNLVNYQHMQKEMYKYCFFQWFHNLDICDIVYIFHVTI